MAGIQTVSETVSRYFKAVGNPIAFQIVSATPAQDGGFRVVCEFYPWMGAQGLSRYNVDIDADGDIVSVVRADATGS